MKRLLGFAVVALAAGAIFAFRFDAFHALEPRSDQAFFAWWIAGIDAASHFLPQRMAGESWFQALARDGDSFLTQALRPIYNAPTVIFQSLTVGIHLIVGKIFGSGIEQQVALSLLANALIAVPVMLFFWTVPAARPTDGEPGLAFGLASIGAGMTVAFSLHLHLFSGLGHHNFGALMLVVGTILTERSIHDFGQQRSRRYVGGLFLPLLIAQGLALYAYKTNLFVLAPATVALLVIAGRADIKAALKLLATYGAVLAVLLAPLVPLIASQALRPAYAQGANFFDPAAAGLGIDMGRYIADTMLRLGAWFVTGAKYFSPAGLAAGLAGLALLAFRRGAMLPLLIVAAHILAWSAIPLFAETGFRTYLYVIPFLAIGMGWLVASLARQAGGGWFRRPLNLAGAAAVGLLLVAHFATQLPPVLDKSRAAEALPEKWHRFFAGQGELRPAYREIESRLPKDAFLMTWGYGLQYLHWIFKAGETPPITLPALQALKLRLDAGQLKAHIAARKLRVPGNAALYVLVDPHIDKIDTAQLVTALADLFGPSGFALKGHPTVYVVTDRHLTSAWPRELKLYEIRFS